MSNTVTTIIGQGYANPLKKAAKEADMSASELATALVGKGLEEIERGELRVQKTISLSWVKDEPKSEPEESPDDLAFDEEEFNSENEGGEA